MLTPLQCPSQLEIELFKVEFKAGLMELLKKSVKNGVLQLISRDKLYALKGRVCSVFYHGKGKEFYFALLTF